MSRPVSLPHRSPLARRRGGLVALLAVAALGCGAEPEPVARLVVTPGQAELPHGVVVPIDLSWEPAAPLDSDRSPVVFVHLVDEAGAVVRTVDHPFPEVWQAGARVEETIHLYHSAIAPPLPAGSYDLVVGLYDGRERRWPLATDGEAVGRNEYAVSRVVVPETPPAKLPRTTFGPTWTSPEPSGDAQSVARRWLAGPGEIAVEEVPTGGGTLWVEVVVPSESETLRLVLADQAEHPVVGITSDCGGFAATVSGPGRRELAIPVPAGTERCRVEIDPNFRFVEMESLRELSVSIDQLGWSDRTSS